MTAEAGNGAAPRGEPATAAGSPTATAAGAPAGIGDDAPEPGGPPRGLVIGPEPYDGPAAVPLVDELDADIARRYADDDDAEDADLWAVTADQVRPPVGTFLVARLDGLPVGCGGVRPMRGAPAGVGEVKRMYTRPEARGRGVARLLLARLETEAAALGYRRLHLETGLRQAEAIALYEDVGYRRIPDYGPYAGHPLTLCMGKDLLRP